MEWPSPSSLVVCGGKLLECLDRWEEVRSTTNDRGIPSQSITDAILSSRHPSGHACQAMLITTEANTHRSMRSRCPNRVLRRMMCCSPPCSSSTVRDRQTHRARDARLIATGLGEDCWPRELPDEFANNLIQAPAKLARRSSDMLVLLACRSNGA